MPGPEEAEFDKMFGTAASDDEEAEFDALLGTKAEPSPVSPPVAQEPTPVQAPLRGDQRSEDLEERQVPEGQWLGTGGQPGAPEPVVEMAKHPFAALRGAGKGLANWGDEIAAGVKTGGGLWGDYEAQRKQEMAAQEQAAQENPVAFNAGQAVTGAAPMAIPGGAAVQAAAGVAMPALAAAGGAQPGQRGEAIVNDVTTNPLSYLAGAGLPVAAKGAGALGEGLGKAADDFRLKTFTTPSQRGKLANQLGGGLEGRNNLRAVARDIEDRGWHRKPGILGHLLPGNAEDLATNAAQAAKEAGPRIGQAEAAFTSNPNMPSVENQPLGDALRRRAAEQRTVRGDRSLRDKAAEYMTEQADELAPLVGPPGEQQIARPLTFKEALDSRKGYGANANYMSKSAAANETPAHDDIRKFAYSQLRKAEDDALDRAMITGAADPDMVQQYHADQKTFHRARQVEEPAWIAADKEVGGGTAAGLLGGISPVAAARSGMDLSTVTSAASGTARKMSAASSAVGGAAAAGGRAQRGLTGEDLDKRNSEVKQEIQDLQREPSLWQRFLGRFQQ